VVTWEQFSAQFQWLQGEHAALIGPTGAGKTTLSLLLIQIRQYVTVFATKPQDPVLRALLKQNYKLMSEWKSYDPDLIPKRLLWPEATKLYAAKNQQRVFKDAFNNIYPQGGWCVYLDELWYVIHHLKLELELRTFLLQGRSMDISLLCCTQRPSRVPLEIYDQSTHLFFWRDNDEVNLRRISGLAGVSSSDIQAIVAQLPRYQCLYINTRENIMLRFTPPSGVFE
jgi:energy-coupling factor transporter ATP-binding protein EcfA2